MYGFRASENPVPLARSLHHEVDRHPATNLNLGGMAGVGIGRGYFRGEQKWKDSDRKSLVGQMPIVNLARTLSRTLVEAASEACAANDQ